MLKSHYETRELPVFALILARDDARPGPNLRAATAGCVAQNRASPRPAPPVSLPPGAARPPCGLRLAFGHISGGAVTIAELADAVSRNVNRKVLDRTGMRGTFDVALNFTPEAARLDAAAESGKGAIGREDPSIFTALGEQLGLTLEPTRDLVDVLIIDRVERPSPN